MDWVFWLQLLIRSSLILVVGEGLRRCTSRTNALLRYRILQTTLLMLALLPVLSICLPEVHVGFTHKPADLGNVQIQEITRAIRTPIPMYTRDWPLVLWFAGVVLALVPVLIGTVTFQRLLRRSQKLRDPEWTLLLSELLPSRNSHPQLVVSSQIEVPVTGGVFRPTILLPASSVEWSQIRRRAVLSHELSHVVRRDVPLQFGVHLLAALWWFQPVVWLLRRSMRLESEFVADASAVANGLRPSDYATELLAIARGSNRLAPRYGISMLSGELEARLRAVLSPAKPIFSRSRAAMIFAGLLFVSITAAAVSTSPSQGLSQQGGYSMKRVLLSGLLASAGLSAATLSGTIYDAGGAVIPEAKVLLYSPDSGVKQEGVTGSDGRFAVDVYTAGQYILRAEKPGFDPLFREFDLKENSKIDRGFTLEIASAHQTVSVAGKGVAANSATTRPAGPIRVGGNVAAANLISRKQPVYPDAAKAAGIQGTVELDSVISKEGIPMDVRVSSSPDSSLSEAAMEAVSQWRYRPTLLNGTPVEVRTVVLVHFTLSQ
jgi:TonB family protein